MSIIEELFETERRYLLQFFDNADMAALENVLEELVSCRGLIVLTGVGKSGLMAKKTAVTMTSTGSRAIFLSPTNALHGDLGMLHPGDVFVIFSKSGESDELLNVIPYVRNLKVRMIGITQQPNSRLAKAVDLAFILPPVKEICPYDMAPTTSTTIQTIVGDVLAIALMRRKRISKTQFALHHPAGRIGKRVTLKVSDLMLRDMNLPVCRPDDKLVDTLVELTNKQCGCVLIVNPGMQLLGIFTDGDLRRSLQEGGAKALQKKMSQVMTENPRTASADLLAYEALRIMEADQKHPITVLPVITEERVLIGLIKMHDIVQSGI